MAKLKRYELIKGMSLMTYFLVEGNPVTVTFQGGLRLPEVKRGWFITANKGLQDAIESSNGFNVQYKLIGEQDIPDEEPVVPPEAPVSAMKFADLPEDIIDYPEVVTVKDARQKLIDLYPDLKPAQLPNKVVVLAKAKEKNVTFSKLQ